MCQCPHHKEAYWHERNVEGTEHMYSKHLSVKPFFKDSATFYIHRNISIHRYISCLREIEIQIFKLITAI